MSGWELLDDGSFNGVRKWIKSSAENEGTVSIRYEGHDIPLILAQNKAERDAKNGTKMGDGLEKAASIPCSVLYQWLVEDGIWAPNDPEYTKRKLNDPDWRYLKCRDIII